MTDHLQEVRAKIIEAVPEIVELKFGCEIDSQGKANKLLYVGHSNHQHAVHAILKDKSTAMLMVDEVFTSTIIGRPVTLADVLMAIDYVRPVKQCWYVRYDGIFFDSRDEKWSVNWNLALPFDEQKPEVIEFLHKILCV